MNISTDSIQAWFKQPARPSTSQATSQAASQPATQPAMQSVKQPRYYAVSPAFQKGVDTHQRWQASLSSAIGLGAEILQYRDKQATDQDYIEHVTWLASVLPGNVALIVNDRWHVLPTLLDQGVQVHGVHVGQGDGDVAAIRKAFPTLLLGVTCHSSLEFTRQAIDQGADYVAFGRLLPSVTKPQAPQADLLSTLMAINLARANGVSSVGIGGITPQNTHEVDGLPLDWLAMGDGLFPAI